MTQNLNTATKTIYDHPIIITRAIDEAEVTANFFEEKGFKTICEPVFTLEIHPLLYPDLFIFDGLIITSQQALKALPNNPELHSKPLFTFGHKTIQMAEEIGFDMIISAGKTAYDLAEFIAKDETNQTKNLCYLRGEDISFDFAKYLKQHHIIITEKIAYKAHAIDRFTPHFIQSLPSSSKPVILFFSKRSADIFLSLYPQEKSDSCLFGCFSENIANFILQKSNTPQSHIFYSEKANMDSLFDKMKRFLYSQR